ncbi:tetratricopeptide repeat protein [Gracilimonas mengyeensis]|uniref:Tetratricopeptide repeat-containing protein n=1 Tax=Gracilimonas mengyeensis TaxID=1302730 RepID=A0A521E581_9BACT|nr:tetratricopeptide repeat protein [Gracilimonas mengyeensis]SMO79093.1 Tetratricopeptide repeat-containing protein [Gracilimonas mengyeensis]
MNFEEKLNKGFELLQEKDIDYALDVARELQKEYPESHEAFYLEALVMQQLNQFDHSQKAIEKALELTSEENAAYYNLRGNIRMQLEKLDEAEEDFDKAIEVNDSSAAHRNKVLLMLMTDRGQDAIPYLINRIKNDPKDAENWILMGDMIQKGGQPDKARTYYEQALKIDPDNEYAQRQLEEE